VNLIGIALHAFSDDALDALLGASGGGCDEKFMEEVFRIHTIDVFSDGTRKCVYDDLILGNDSENEQT
jgi:hypothetical protein